MNEEDSRGKKHVKWDEEKLKETEKYRGTYQKIQEPKTPYHSNHSQEEDHQMDVEGKTPEELEVEEGLKKAQKNRETNTRKKVDLAALNAKLREEMKQYKDEGQMEEEDAESEEKRRKRQQFKKKRAAHYNEFKQVQQAKQNKWQDDSD